jgi:hypothetical protein
VLGVQLENGWTSNFRSCLVGAGRLLSSSLKLPPWLGAKFDSGYSSLARDHARVALRQAVLVQVGLNLGVSDEPLAVRSVPAEHAVKALLEISGFGGKDYAQEVDAVRARRRQLP